MGEERLYKVSKADILWVAHRWEEMVGFIDYPTKSFAFHCLLNLKGYGVLWWLSK